MFPLCQIDYLSYNRQIAETHLLELKITEQRKYIAYFTCIFHTLCWMIALRQLLVVVRNAIFNSLIPFAFSGWERYIRWDSLSHMQMFKPKCKKRSVSMHPAPKAISFFLCFIFLIKPISIQPKIKTKIEFNKIIVNSFIPNDSLTSHCT